ncbi:MAG: hypothetical protein CMJ32_08490 [Phycisphaerae bacterium]|nr:hypothetical protein [Phycisphaerae bacterium]
MSNEKDQSNARPWIEPDLDRCALIGFFCSLFGLVTCGVTGVPGLILSGIALQRIRSGTGRPRGGRIAVVGILLGGIGLIILLVSILQMGPLAIEAARVREEMSRLELVSSRFQQWLQQNDQALPGRSSWHEDLGLDTEPAAMTRDVVFNAAIPYQRLDQLEQPAEAVVFFIGRPGTPNMALPSTAYIRNGVGLVIRGDGRVETCPAESSDWNPSTGETGIDP